MKQLLFILALTFSMAVSAQDRKALETDAARFYNNTTTGKYEALIADTYPEIFKIIPKEKMMEGLKAMLKGDGYVMDILEEPANFNFGEIKQINSGSYCIIKHDLVMKMTFLEPLGEAEAKEMVKNLKASMKTEDVTFNPKYNSFTIKQKADIIAISNANTTGKWKFLNRAGHGLMTKVLGEEVCKELAL
ncbi:hypothetical protein ACLI1A_18790 [Flavobacterium sp. RHBU_3]|uniref:hypothetical protein n=1 Tax=Flavobacterium sp. RHBU_3 TaxID=3391184 RepID=UPI0039848CF8